MKKGLLKSILCFALAGTLLFGDAGIALAATANDTQATTEAKQPRSTTTASVDYLSVNVYEYGSIEYSYGGYADKFEVYVNGVKIEDHTYNNTHWEDSVYDEATDSYVDVYAEAPYGSNWGYLGVNVQPGATYEVKVVPYTHSGVAGTAKTAKGSVEFPTVSSMSSNVVMETIYDKDGKTTGYAQYKGIELRTYVNDYMNTTWEIYRSTKESSGYKKIGTVTTYGTVYYNDTTAKMGTTYYYKVRPVAVVDTYVKKQVNGAYSAPYKVEAGKPEIDEIYGTYLSEGVEIYTYSSSMVTGIDVYRSTKKSSGYKKIATTSDTYYLDKSVKADTTYYYKLKPFFYDIAKGKKVYGEYSEVLKAKTTMGSVTRFEANLTSKSKAKLEWDKVKGAASYDIYMREGAVGEAYKYVGSTKKTSYTIKNLNADTVYSFQLRVVKKANTIKSAYRTVSASVDTGFHSPSVEITKRTVSIKNGTMTIKSTLKWDIVYGAKKYRVEAYDRTKNKVVTLKTLSKNTQTSYTLTNTKKEGQYWRYDDIKVYAIKGDKEYATYEYDTDSLAAVTGVKAKKKSATSATVSWKKVSGADTYYVYRQSPNGREAYIGTTNKTSIVDTLLTPGVNYTYRVSAYNSKYGVSSVYEYDIETGMSTNYVAYNHKVTAPKISSVKNSASKKATITWKKAAYATKYEIYRATSKNGTYKKVGTTSKLTYTDSKLSKGKTYYYKIVAVTTNDAGITVKSAKSDYKSVKIKK